MVNTYFDVNVANFCSIFVDDGTSGLFIKFCGVLIALTYLIVSILIDFSFYETLCRFHVVFTFAVVAVMTMLCDMQNAATQMTLHTLMCSFFLVCKVYCGVLRLCMCIESGAHSVK